MLPNPRRCAACFIPRLNTVYNIATITTARRNDKITRGPSILAKRRNLGYGVFGNDCFSVKRNKIAWLGTLFISVLATDAKL